MSAENNHKKRNIWLIILGAFFLAVGILWLFYWLLVGRFYVSTEDAYVHGNQVMLTPQVAAAVQAIYADDTDLVEEGQLVVELDPTDYLIAISELQKSLGTTVREVAALFQNAEARAAEIELRAAELRQAELDLKHREPLVKTGAVSLEEFETYQTNVAVAKASLVYAEKEYEAAQALVVGTSVATHPRVQKGVWELRQAYLDLIRCKIWAPATGYVAKRSAQVGDQVAEGQTLLFIVPLQTLWINANYKETHLRKVRIGQKVRYTADIYGDHVKFHGKVLGFQPGSGSAFSLLPPENASGNWIKIIQRVPVRISVDPDAVKDHPLFLGLSTRVTIDVHETNGDMLAQKPRTKPLYTTDIYDKQLEELATFTPFIDKIIEENQ